MDMDEDEETDHLKDVLKVIFNIFFFSTGYILKFTFYSRNCVLNRSLMTMKIYWMKTMKMKNININRLQLENRNNIIYLLYLSLKTIRYKGLFKYYLSTFSLIVDFPL